MKPALLPDRLVPPEFYLVTWVLAAARSDPSDFILGYVEGYVLGWVAACLHAAPSAPGR